MTDATSSFRDAQRGLPLTDTHRRALDALSRGATWRRLSRSLDTTVDGVKHQLRGLYARLDAHNAAHAVRLGFEAGLLRPDAPTVDPWARRPRGDGALLGAIRRLVGYLGPAAPEDALVATIEQVRHEAAALWWLVHDDAPTGVDVDELRRAGLLLRDGFTSLARAVRQPTEPTRVTHDRRAADG